MRVLITAFKPFSNHSFNPSQLYLERGIKVPFEFDAQIFDVSYQALEKFRPKDYDLIFNLGVNTNSPDISIESIALNLDHSPQGDNQKIQREQQTIFEDAPLALKTEINMDHGLEIKAPFKNKLSFHAGTYLCNHIFFRSLYFNKNRALFLHLPHISNRELPSLFGQLNSIVSSIYNQHRKS